MVVSAAEGTCRLSALCTWHTGPWSPPAALQVAAVDVASIYDPVHSILAEYVWATLEAFTMYGDSIVWNDDGIGWNDLPKWVRSLNRAEARHAGTAPDDKRMWSASEVLEMVGEATSSGR